MVEMPHKFKIGEMLQLKQDPAGYRGEGKRRFLVVERWLQECSGGQQKKYSMRLWSRADTGHVMFDEMELEPYVEPKKAEADGG